MPLTCFSCTESINGTAVIINEDEEEKHEYCEGCAEREIMSLLMRKSDFSVEFQEQDEQPIEENFGCDVDLEIDDFKEKQLFEKRL